MEGNNQEPQFAGTLDLETGTATRGGEEPNISDDPNSGANADDTAAADGGTGGEGNANPAAAAAQTAGEGAAASTAAADPAKNTDYLKNWNERAGTQYQTEEELIEEIKSGRGLKEKLTDYEKKIGELSVLDDPFVRDIAKAKKAGIGIELYLEAVKMDVDKLDAKSALKEDFLRNNAELVATDPEFAGMKFERDYQAKYGILGEILDVAGLDEAEAQAKTLAFNRDQEFIKRSLNADSVAAKKRLNDWKKQHITIPDVTQQAGMTDAQIQQYTSQVDSFVSKKEKIEIPVGENKFNFELKEYKETLKKELLNPFETLKKCGIDVDTGLIDAEKLGQLLIDAHVGRNLAKPLSDWSIDGRNIEYLKTKKVIPAPAQPIAAGVPAGSEDDMLARFGKGIKAQREAEALRQS